MFTRRILALAATLVTALAIAGSTAGAAAGPSHSDARGFPCIVAPQTCTTPGTSV
jgi:hypothetical protein